MTAAKAVDGNNHPLDPVISIYVDQPKSDSNETMHRGKVGHAMLGIEYTRFSKITDRYERCKLQYGFYPAADYASKLSSVMMGLHRGCRSPEKASPPSAVSHIT